MHVLLGVRGSEESELALESTIERAREAGDELTVAVFAGDGESVDEVEDWARSRLEETELTTHVRRIEDDHPASSLVELAETGPYDQLVIGGGEESPMGKIELGTTTEFVLLNAQMTVRLER